MAEGFLAEGLLARDSFKKPQNRALATVRGPVKPYAALLTQSHVTGFASIDGKPLKLLGK